MHQRIANVAGLDVHLCQHAAGLGVVQIEQGQRQVLGSDKVLVEPPRFALCVGDDAGEGFGERDEHEFNRRKVEGKRKNVGEVSPFSFFLFPFFL